MSTTTHATDDQREAARRYLQQRSAFRVHAAVFGLSMVGIIIVNALVNAAAGITGEWRAWWSGLALIGWGLGIAIHGLAVWMAHPRRDSAREEQQIDEILSSSR